MPVSTSMRDQYSISVLMHELNHQYGASDHYHEEDAYGNCLRPDICSQCNGAHARPATCIMNDSSIDINAYTVICSDCWNEIITHLNANHIYIEE